MDKYLLGQRIKQARSLRDCTLSELATHIGVHKSTLSRYENGEFASPKIPVIEAISNYLHVNPAWLVGKSELISFTPKNSDFMIFSPCSPLFRPLKTLREDRGISVDDMAFRIGISAEDYLKVEAGADVNCMTAVRIAVCLDCDIDHLLSFDGISSGESRLQTDSIEKSLIKNFRQLNAEGQNALLVQLSFFLEQDIYKNTDTNYSVQKNA